MNKQHEGANEYNEHTTVVVANEYKTVKASEDN